MTRHFIRCPCCLSVVAIDGELPRDLQCETCALPTEYMGHVEQDRLIQEHHLCPCDDRCTAARGPLCTCKCRGKNHGRGLLTVVVRVDCGAAPTVRPHHAADAAERRDAFRACHAALVAEMRPILDRRARREFLPRPVFDRLRALQAANNKAWKAREYRARMRAYLAVGLTPPTAEPDDRPIVAVTATAQPALAW